MRCSEAVDKVVFPETDSSRYRQPPFSSAAAFSAIVSSGPALFTFLGTHPVAVVANSRAGIRWLSTEPADLANARAAAQRIIRDGGDASARIRGHISKDLERVAVNVPRPIFPHV